MRTGVVAPPPRLRRFEGGETSSNDPGRSDRPGTPSLVIHDQWWLGVLKEDGTGEGGRVEGDAGASSGGSVAQSNKGRGIWDSGSACMVFGYVQ